MSRLEQFRSVITRLDPVIMRTGEEFYVAPPTRAVSDQLTTRFQVSPASSNLLIGGIGTGKSTQLRRVTRLFGSDTDTRAVYIDVSQRHDLNKKLGGVLTALAGVELSDVVTSSDVSVTKAKTQFREWAFGTESFVPYEYDGEPDPSDYEPGDYVKTPGAITPPRPALGDVHESQIRAFATLLGALPDGIKHFVVLFDSLDRIPDVDAIGSIVEDLRVLKQSGVGVALVGPQRLQYGSYRAFFDYFDHALTMPPLNVIGDEHARVYLQNIIARRVDSMVSVPMQRRLVEWSGGIVRDLIELTRTAIEEAFVAGSDEVTEDHILRAVDVMGRTLMVGLSKDDINKLRTLKLTHQFVRIDDNDLDLLTSRRILEYQTPTAVHRVHPTMEHLLNVFPGWMR